MFEEIGHHVEKIKRVRYGNLELDVHPGKFRKLTTEEVDRLKLMTKPGTDPRRFIPIFTKPKVTYAKTDAQPTKTKFYSTSRLTPIAIANPPDRLPERVAGESNPASVEARLVRVHSRPRIQWFIRENLAAKPAKIFSTIFC